MQRPKEGSEKALQEQRSRDPTFTQKNPGSAAIHVPENAKPTDDTPPSRLPQLPPEKNVPFEAVTGLDTQLTALHGGLPPRNAFLLFSGHSDLHGSRSFRQAGIKARGKVVVLLPLLIRESRWVVVVVVVPAWCSRAWRTIGCSRRRLCARMGLFVH